MSFEWHIDYITFEEYKKLPEEEKKNWEWRANGIYIKK